MGDLKASTKMYEEARALLGQALTERDVAVGIVHDCERDMKTLRERIHDLTVDLGVEFRARAIINGELDRAWAKIDSAEHDTYCSSRIPVPEGPGYPCNCWKSRP